MAPRFVNLLIIIIFITQPVVTSFFSPPVCFFAFLVASVIPFFAGKSRRVTDPLAGISTPSELSPRDFHEWAKLVCSSNRYSRAYDLYVYNTNRGVNQKLQVTLSQIKAINFIHAWKFVLFVLLALDTFCLYDLFFSNQIVDSPVLLIIMVGILWEYALGVYVL